MHENKDINAIKERLNELYPDKVVHRLGETDLQLCGVLLRLAHDRNISIFRYLESIGYCSKISGLSDADIFEGLVRLYPDYQIYNLKEKNAHLYTRIVTRRKYYKVGIEEYLNGLGFTYRTQKSLQTEGNTQKPEETDSEANDIIGRKQYSSLIEIPEIASIANQLDKLFPYKVVWNIGKQDVLLYGSILKIADELNLSVGAFLNLLGFKIRVIGLNDETFYLQLKKLFPDNHVSYLATSNKKLYTQISSRAKSYNVSLQQYLEALGFSYKQKQAQETQEQKDIAAKEETKIKQQVKEMFPNREVLLTSLKGNSELYSAILLLGKKQRKTVAELLCSFGFSILTIKVQSERILVSDILKHFPDRKIQNLRQVDEKLYKRISVRASNRNMSMKRYLQELGFQTYNPGNA